MAELVDELKARRQAERRRRQPPGDGGGERPASSWIPVDLSTVLSSEYHGAQPDVCNRTDGQPLLYPGRVHWLHGEPESGKSWMALMAIAEVISAGLSAVLFDFEDDAPAIVDRLRRLGVDDLDIVANLRYVRPEAAMNPTDIELVRTQVLSGCILAVIDATTAAMALEGLDPVKTADTTMWLQRLPALAARAGAAVLVLDHVVKSQEDRGRWAIGSQAKLAVVTGAAYGIIAREPIAPGHVGRSVLVIAKDRPGAIRASSPNGKTAGELVIDARDPDRMRARIEPPPDYDAGDTFRPTHLMERVSRYLEANGEQAKGAIENDVHGKRGYVRAALDALVSDSFIVLRDGPRGAQLYSSLAPFREADLS